MSVVYNALIDETMFCRASSLKGTVFRQARTADGLYADRQRSSSRVGQSDSQVAFGSKAAHGEESTGAALAERSKASSGNKSMVTVIGGVMENVRVHLERGHYICEEPRIYFWHCEVRPQEAGILNAESTASSDEIN
jgi:hypothetical protein